MKGYTQRMLRVNLTTGNIKKETIASELLDDYIGGKGLSAKILYDELAAGIDPLGPLNKLVFTTGPLQGTIVPLTGRHCVYSKSPLTGTICDSYSGGFFGVELKYAGYDSIIIEGMADSPVYLYINDDTVELRDAGRYWGLDTHETEDRIREDMKDETFQIACIGQAGENLVKYASIINNKHNAAARGGLGAVMGSKKLKAISVRGSRDVAVGNASAVSAAAKHARENLEQSGAFWENFPSYGTSLTVDVTNVFGISPTKNFQTGVMEDFKKIGGDELKERMVIGQRACFGCNISCNKGAKIDRGLLKGLLTDRQEYETMFAFGGECGNTNLESVILGGHLCNKYGMDTISAGVTIGLAMELFTRKIISGQDTGGLDFEFGNYETLLKAIDMIAFRDGFGDHLAEGSRRLSARYHPEGPDYSMQVKGLEIAGYDPRGAKGMAICYATANRGACHNYSYTIGPEMWTEEVDRFSIEGKAQLNIELQNITAVVNSAILCKFPFDNVIWTLKDVAEMINSVTGKDYSEDDLYHIGDRIYNLERLFNAREGFGRQDDTLPDRFTSEPMPEGPAEGHTVDLTAMLNEYYHLRGWDEETGNPAEKTLKQLGLT
jgi:aldehyde:ferredoxin oxidoreductase